ncbi:HET-domain-containing protein [Xylaria palmicola]|nr:HET-domain-containing protein [Xylaria palmicola]
MAPVEPYIHKPLPSERSFRLISLEPSIRPDAQIHCTITTAYFDNLPDGHSYEALSYVWGSPTGTVPVYCDGKVFLVTPNCHDALRHLRLRFRPRMLWLDAICIDQRKTDRSTRERNNQVQMMWEIYGGAQRVLVWLGPGDDFTPWAFRMLRIIDRLWNRPHETRLVDAMSKKLVDKLYYSNGRMWRKNRVAMGALFQNSWFSRAWTVQEVAFAREAVVLCGKTELPADLLAQAGRGIIWLIPDLRTFWLVALRNNTYVELLGRKAKRLANPELPSDLRRKYETGDSGIFRREDELWARMIGHLDSTVPQDRIYGVYSLLKASGLDLPDVDYNKSVAEIYGETAKAFIKREPRSLHILYVSIRPSGADEFPTWTPNWETGCFHMPQSTGVDFTGTYKFMDDAYHASGNSIAAMPSLSPPNELQVRGRIIGTVSHAVVSPTASEPPDPSRLSARLSGFTRACRDFLAALDQLNLLRPYGDEAGVQRAVSLALTLSLDLQAENGQQYADDEVDPAKAQELLRLWLDVFKYPNCEIIAARDIDSRSRLKDADDTGEGEEARRLRVIERALDCDRPELAPGIPRRGTAPPLVSASWFHREVCGELANWAFLFLDSGHIGRAYFHARADDQVALLAGSGAPFLLRKADSGHNHYRVVAPAFICGVMDGELWPGDNESGIEDMILV